ncbi:elongation of very long chain fatty acids protein 7-like [Panonychus citri]|uniref:elongation of very long chain fatty acids protein 7-like n=1 Tax=Panonychus citri TaxID=50023 RepID=UPI002307F474|nr:elongation of very long chain fatty acids protein 7-like [Panonychus citri]
MSLIFNSYNSIMELSDKRLADWPLMSSPLSTMTICLSYVYFVKYLGPKLMKNRPPFELRGLMIAYNFLMVLISALIVYFYGVSGWLTNYSYKCQPVDYSNSPDALIMAKTSYFYYIVKYIEFCDTLFFVLRKKYDHISTLHVIHHGIMPFSVWWGVKFVPGGHATFFSFLNSFIHVIMYTYYGLAAIGPHMNKYLGWKKYLTAMQMVQFVLIFIHSFQLIFRNCNFPKAFMVWIGCHGILFWFLFSDFYKRTYSKKDRSTSSSFTNGAVKSSTDKIEQLKHAIEKRLN